MDSRGSGLEQLAGRDGCTHGRDGCHRELLQFDRACCCRLYGEEQVEQDEARSWTQTFKEPSPVVHQDT